MNIRWLGAAWRGSARRPAGGVTLSLSRARACFNLVKARVPINKLAAQLGRIIPSRRRERMRAIYWIINDGEQLPGEIAKCQSAFRIDRAAPCPAGVFKLVFVSSKSVYGTFSYTTAARLRLRLNRNLSDGKRWRIVSAPDRGP